MNEIVKFVKAKSELEKFAQTAPNDDFYKALLFEADLDILTNSLTNQKKQ